MELGWSAANRLLIVLNEFWFFCLINNHMLCQICGGWNKYLVMQKTEWMGRAEWQMLRMHSGKKTFYFERPPPGKTM